ncbi:MAG: hypothetical protein N2712_05565 [Brevinematales bacterium]|nr:hypothetical protein [Brevinematales bacterium]
MKISIMNTITLFIILTSIIGCSKFQETEVFSVKIPSFNSLLKDISKVEYVNGHLNFVIAYNSNDIQILNVNKKTISFHNASVKNVIFSNKTNKFIVTFISNRQNYLTFEKKITRVKDFNNLFFKKINNKLEPFEIIENNYNSESYSIPDIKISTREGKKYIILENGREIGPFEDIEIPSFDAVSRNWWTVARSSKDNYTLIINGVIAVDQANNIGIPSFFGTNFIVDVRKNNTNIILLNYKEIPIQPGELIPPLLQYNRWFAILVSNENYMMIGGEIDNQKYYVLLHSTNPMSYPYLDNYGNSWIIQEGKSKFLVKNYKKVLGPYEDIYSLQLNDKRLVFIYKSQGSWFLKDLGKEYGPFESIGEVFLVGNKILFNYESRGKNYVVYGNKVLGPYTRVIKLKTENHNDIIVFYEDNGKIFISLNGKTNLGPYDEVFWDTFSYKFGNFIFTFRMDNEIYINYSSKIFGPFKKVFMPILSDNGKSWGAGVMMEDNSFFLIFNGKLIGNYVSVDYDTIRINTKYAKWGGISQKNNGYYVSTSYFEMGPFERITQIKFSDDLTSANFISKVSNKYYVFYVRNGNILKKLGPYEMAVFVENDFNSNTIVVKKNKSYFVLNGKELFGPYDYIKSIINGSLYIAKKHKKDILLFNNKSLEMDNIVDIKTISKNRFLIIGFRNGEGILVDLNKNKTNTHTILVKTENLINDSKFSWVIKKNEWQYLLFDGEEIGPFNQIDIKSLKFETKTSSYGVIATKNGKKYIISNLGAIGPFEDIKKYIIVEGNIFYLSKVGNENILSINTKPNYKIKNVIDFDIDYKRYMLSFILLDNNNVVVKTLKLKDLLNLRN